MPELPEVETIVRGLSNSLTGKTFKKVVLRRPNLRIPFPDNFSKILEGRAITAVKRRAKYILIELEDQTVLIVHLGMSGRMLIKDHLPEKLEKHDHVIMSFTDGTAVIYNDARRFGLMTLSQIDNIDSHKFFCNLGPDPLSNHFNEDVLGKKLKNKNTPIKHALMDQRVIAGLGNIYVCESLFRSGISPKRKAHSVSKEKLHLLTISIKDVITEAIESGGTTLRDYISSTGDLGYFKQKLAVYGREKEPCIKCHQPLKRIVQQGRSSFYCGNCQK